MLPHVRRARSGNQFKSDEEGGMSTLGLFMCLSSCAIGAIALDVTHLFAARTQLQVAADLAAHAALYNRETNNEQVSASAAINAVEIGMPTENFGEVLSEENIEFGYYDWDNREFVPDAMDHSAVRVVTGQLIDEGNPVESFLFRTIGIKDWDVQATSVYATYRPSCFREGFVADGIVDLQSRNGFTSGFCVHSNSHVSLNQNNFFEPGTVVSMPDPNMVDLPRSGFERNEGLEAALREGAYRMRILNQIDEIFDGVQTYGSEWVPDYIAAAGVINMSNVRNLDPSDLTPNRIHYINCRGNKLSLDPGTYSNAVIVSPCPITFGNGAILEDAVLATTDNSFKSITGSSGVQIGRDDDCAEGGGAQILTLGGVDFPADLQMYNGQIIAVGDIAFAANADGIKGASMIAGGEISGTSNMEMGFCGTGNESNFEVDYFRLVE